MQQQAKLEENELDDAISVFRNHCEPQHPLGIPISNMDNSSYVGPSPLVNTIGPATQDNSNPTNEPPTTIKLERVPANSSEFIDRQMHHVQNGLTNNFVIESTEKRKEPPDTDTKPSSSSVDGSQKGGKRARR